MMISVENYYESELKGKSTDEIMTVIRSLKKKIAKILGISDNTVRSFCRRNGLDGKAKNTIACKQCGKLIKVVPKQKPKKFCSDSCRNAWWKEHLECITKKAVYEFTCASCGRYFTAYGNSHRKYCSHGCCIAGRFGKKCGRDE